MTTTETVTQEIASLEKEVMEKQERLNQLRRTMPREKVKDYVLKGPRGKEMTLSEHFGEHRDLIVIHNMGRDCPYCTLWADGFDGLVDHLESRAGFVVVSPDPTEVQEEIAKSRGWRFNMASAAESSFTEDMGFIRDHNGTMGPWPGYSTFHREDDGSIVRVAHGSFGPGDTYCSIWHLFAVLADGVNDWQPKLKY